MWYVMQVQSGNEEKIRLQCETFIDETVLESCFIPHYQEKKIIKGEWKIYEKRLFPGYLFMVTDQLDELRKSLIHVNGMTKLIGAGDEIIPLTEREIAFLNKFGGPKHTVEMSEGIIEGEKIIVTEGPLIGFEGNIKKIDRHKRKAWIEVEMFGGMQKVEVGLEIVKKTV